MIRRSFAMADDYAISRRLIFWHVQQPDVGGNGFTRPDRPAQKVKPRIGLANGGQLFRREFSPDHGG